MDKKIILVQDLVSEAIRRLEDLEGRGGEILEVVADDIGTLEDLVQSSGGTWAAIRKTLDHKLNTKDKKHKEMLVGMQQMDVLIQGYKENLKIIGVALATYKEQLEVFVENTVTEAFVPRAHDLQYQIELVRSSMGSVQRVYGELDGMVDAQVDGAKEVQSKLGQLL
jgi:hypothetical protein